MSILCTVWVPVLIIDITHKCGVVFSQTIVNFKGLQNIYKFCSGYFVITQTVDKLLALEEKCYVFRGTVRSVSMQPPTIRSLLTLSNVLTLVLLVFSVI